MQLQNVRYTCYIPTDKGLQMKSEMQANQALANMAEERMSWVAVLGEKPASKRPAPKRGFWSIVFGL